MQQANATHRILTEQITIQLKIGSWNILGGTNRKLEYFRDPSAYRPIRHILYTRVMANG